MAEGRTKQPAYIRIENSLRKRIHQGVWPVGVTLPSREALAQEFDVGVSTVHQAISNLIADGIVTSEHGRGTYVIDRHSVSEPETRPSRKMNLAVVAGIYPVGSPQYLGSAERTAPLLANIERTHSMIGGMITFYGRQHTGVDWEPMRQVISRIDIDATDGIILVGIHVDLMDSVDLERSVEESPVPVVCLTSGELPGIIPHVFYDNRYGGYMAAKHLLDLGYEEIVYAAPHISAWGEARLAGIRQAISRSENPRASLSISPAPHTSTHGPQVSAEQVRAGGELCARELMSAAQPPRAIIALNDSAALGFMDAARELGFEAGKDYAIIGFDNSGEARFAGLSSIQVPAEAMAEQAVRLLDDILNGRHGSTQVRVRPHLVHRRTTGVKGCTH